MLVARGSVFIHSIRLYMLRGAFSYVQSISPSQQLMWSIELGFKWHGIRFEFPSISTQDWSPTCNWRIWLALHSTDSELAFIYRKTAELDAEKTFSVDDVDLYKNIEQECKAMTVSMEWYQTPSLSSWMTLSLTWQWRSFRWTFASNLLNSFRVFLRWLRTNRFLNTRWIDSSASKLSYLRQTTGCLLYSSFRIRLSRCRWPQANSRRVRRTGGVSLKH